LKVGGYYEPGYIATIILPLRRTRLHSVILFNKIKLLNMFR